MDPRPPSTDGRDRRAIPMTPGAGLPPPRLKRSSLVLHIYTGATIVAGLTALAWASVNYDIWPTISLTQAGGREGILLGLLFWILLGLLGGTRVEQLHGYGVLTFHLPFIIAATALGGPVAGGWVAMVSTIEARELREVPWYGTLANHSAMALSAVLGGVVFETIRDGPLGSIADQPQATQLVALVIATFVMSALSAGLATGTVILRDDLSAREALRLMDTSYRTTSASEVVMGWVLTVAYSTIGWWAALICATLVLVIWQAHDAREIARHDAMTGLLSRAGFDARFAEVLSGVRRGAGRCALLAIDLDGFKAINDDYDHATGDEVIREVGRRLRDSIRLTDAAVRRGGDEFGVLFAGVSDTVAAETLARRVHADLCRPVETDKGPVQVGASIGVIIIEPSDRDRERADGGGRGGGGGHRVESIDRLHARADHEMYLAKQAGGGVRIYVPESAQPAS